jgi:hypothetical protein
MQNTVDLKVFHEGVCAQIVFVDGSRSRIFATKEHGMLTIKSMSVMLKDGELAIITGKIQSSKLMERSEFLDRLCKGDQYVSPDEVKAVHDELYGPHELPAVVAEEPTND